jgi:HEAT repeat protein
MNDIEKYDYIEKIYGNSYFDNIDVVLKLLSDTDEGVRIEMIEACYACEQELVRKKLFQMLNDTKGLEKGYLLLTLSYIYQDNKKKIVDVLNQNIHSMDVYEKMDAYIGLIILGYDSYLKEVLKFLESSEYFVRCAALNMLSELIQNNLIKKENFETIVNVVNKIYEKEETQAVKSSIQHLFEIMNLESGDK